MESKLIRKTKYIIKLDQIEQLKPSDIDRLKKVTDKFSFRSNDYYLSLIDWNDPDDPIRRLIVPNEDELLQWGRLDPSDEGTYTVIPGLEHKYDSTALLLISNVCDGICRYCFRKRVFINSQSTCLKDFDTAVRYVTEHKEITNVLLTGGDPLALTTAKLAEIVGRLRQIEHVQIIRMGTKIPAFNPYRIVNDPDFLEIIKSNSYPDKSANFIKNLVLQSANYPEPINKDFWQAQKKEDAEQKRLMTIGYGVPDHAKAISSFNNRVLFFEESSIQVDQAKVFKVEFPESFFATKGDRIFSIVLTYNPPVRRSRGDYYLGNTLEFKVFHTVSPEDVISKISVLDEDQSEASIENKYHLDFDPKVTLRSKGCHQKAVKSFTHTHWTNNPFTSLSIALINRNRWVKVIDDNFLQDYCISLCVYHSEHSSLYSEIRTLNQITLRERARVR